MRRRCGPGSKEIDNGMTIRAILIASAKVTTAPEQRNLIFETALRPCGNNQQSTIDYQPSYYIHNRKSTRLKMPRVTKKDKELGKSKPKSRPTPTSNSGPKAKFDASQTARKRSSASGPPGAGKKTGFKVGPSHAPKDAYLGKGSSSIITHFPFTTM